VRPRFLIFLIAMSAILVGVAAVLGKLVEPGWRLAPVLATAGAAILALFGGTVLPALLTNALARRKLSSAAPKGIVAKRVRAITDPISIGVHPAEDYDGNRVPDYVLRDVDSQLHDALSRSGFVLLVGDASVGKTRTAIEAIGKVLPRHVFVTPPSPDNVDAAVQRAAANRASVLFLDNLQKFLGTGGITREAIVGLLGGRHRHRVIVATLLRTEEGLLVGAGGTTAAGEVGEQFAHTGQGVLDLVTFRIPVEMLFSPTEKERARKAAAFDPRLSSALEYADRYGVPEYLAWGPQLYTMWDDGWARGNHPRGAALVAAAIDCRRTGVSAGLPRSLLERLHTAYLERRGGARLRPEDFSEAWRWATAPTRAGNSLLLSVAAESYDVFAYLVEEHQRRSGEPVPEATMREILRWVSPADATRVAFAAWSLERHDLAVEAQGQAYAARTQQDGPEDPATLTAHSDLAVMQHALGVLSDTEAVSAHRAILLLRTKVLGPDHLDTLVSRENVAVALHRRGRYAEAEREYGFVLDARTSMLGGEHPLTLIPRYNRAVALEQLGRPGEAEAEHSIVLEIRSRVLGPDHRHTNFSRAALARVRGQHSGG
jgi:eukaryotic-like serine/threonine-protein kinase